MGDNTTLPVPKIPAGKQGQGACPGTVCRKDVVVCPPLDRGRLVDEKNPPFSIVNSKKHLDVAILKIDICLRFSHRLRSVLSSPVPSPPPSFKTLSRRILKPMGWGGGVGVSRFPFSDMMAC